jgi:hypothetical protein
VKARRRRGRSGAPGDVHLPPLPVRATRARRDRTTRSGPRGHRPRDRRDQRERPETYPEDAPASLAEEAREAGYTFPYLFDETQEVAKAYHAACTPDFFLFDGDRRLVYRGQFDDSRPGIGRPVTGADLRAAIDATLAGGPVTEDQVPSVGCSIKWRTGNEPD